MDGNAEKVAGRVGANVARLRAEVGMSLADLSALSGIDQSRIGLIEAGRVDCWLSELDAIARALGTSASALFR